MTCPSCGADTYVMSAGDGERAIRCQDTAECGEWHRERDGELERIDPTTGEWRAGADDEIEVAEAGG